MVLFTLYNHLSKNQLGIVPFHYWNRHAKFKMDRTIPACLKQQHDLPDKDGRTDHNLRKASLLKIV